ncbi:patatin-like phospholipase family protein [Pseudonocardia sp. WMMC193]|uniref:patatin-like phospholipase family protein n=1 Tax=Pseudonocardia sp. WMMC193 TaxID=2911965 RepID=UPI001F03286E|nr:patatin-like phospholipase family protein [Pseudonocardia sp. WMMC193]MCF7547811.1 patatin-like phospholipase family protein [Pseudonocardia sp. WMMC193]
MSRIAIACQGGGSHTAFTAGVLARLLRAPELAGHEIVGLSGTSGGAICALLAWEGLRAKDRERAAQLLEAFWRDNSARNPLTRLQNVGMVGAGALQGLGLLPAGTPYALPRFLSGVDQFTSLLSRHVDFAGITADPDAPMLLLGAVDVLTGEFRAFDSRTDRITAECVLASAAIPTLFRAVRTHGGTYWDGLFSQNPPVHDLLATAPDELWVVQINAPAVDREPRTPVEIADRRNGLAGNLSLHQELGFIETVDRMLAAGDLRADRGYKHVTVRVIEMPGSWRSRVLGSASKLNRDVRFLDGLQRRGRDQADRFLGALAFERAVRGGDAEALRAATTEDAVLHSDHPFRPRAGVPLRAHLSTVLAGGAQIDPTRKHVAGDRAMWTLRLRDGLGRAEADFIDGRVSELRLGPVR